MLDILGAFLFGRAARDVAKRKGRSGWWAAVPASMWFAFELPAIVIALVVLRSSAGGSTSILLATFIGLACGALGGWIGYTIVKGLSPLAIDGSVAWNGFPPPAHVVMGGPAKRLAGFCAECDANVWLAADGSCCNGHPSYQISGVYAAPVE